MTQKEGELAEGLDKTVEEVKEYVTRKSDGGLQPLLLTGPPGLLALCVVFMNQLGRFSS